MAISIESALGLVGRPDLVALTSDLVAIPSFKGEETPLARHLADWGGKRGYEVELDEVEPGRFQVILTLKGAGGGLSLMFNGHTDINALTKGWTKDPFVAWVEGERIYGHGAQNMKGGLATFMVAAEAIRRSGMRLKGDLVLAFVVGETQGGEGTHHLMNRDFRTDAAILTEPFGAKNIATIHAGIVHFAIHVYGRSTHISRQEFGVHAINKMAKALQALEGLKFSNAPYPALPSLPRLNVGSIIGGRGEGYLSEPPYVPDLCTIVVDVHFVPGQTIETILADVTRVLEGVKREDGDFEYKIELPPPSFIQGRRKLVMEPVDVSPDEPIVVAIANAIKEDTGRPADQIGAILPVSYSACDTSWLCKAGIPAVNYGPSTGFAHAGQEGAYADLGEMETVSRVLVRVAAGFCETAS